MMQSAIGLNIHVGYVADWGLLLARLDALQPMVTLCHIDNADQMRRVDELKARYPNTRHIVRMYTEGPREGDYHLPGEDGARWRLAPEQFVRQNAIMGRGGLILNAQNEPTGYEHLTALCEWHERAIVAADVAKVRLAGPAFGKGHPALAAPVDYQWSPLLHRLVKAYAQSDGRHWLNLHEYDHRERKADNYLFGRFTRMIATCEALGLRVPDFVVTEWGIDYSGQGTGYKAHGLDGAAYADYLVDAFNAVYRDAVKAGQIKGLCIFSYGDSGGWGTFDVEPDTAFWARLLAIAPKYAAVARPPVVIIPPEPEPTPEPEPEPTPEPEPGPDDEVAKVKAGLALIIQGLQLIHDAL